MMNQYVKIFTLFSVLVLSACGGGSGTSSGGENGGNDSLAPTVAAQPSLIIQSVKTFNFSWTDVSDATYYQLLENADGGSGFTQVGSDIAAGEQSYDHIVTLYARINASYILSTCNDAGCTDSSTVTVTDNLADAIGYFKASNTGANDYFGKSVSLSDDGNTLVISATGEDSSATGVNGDQTDNSVSNAGAVYVFTYDGSTWSQEAYLKASNTETGDQFGSSVSLSSDGNTLAVSARSENSAATGFDGEQTDISASDAGAVYVFSRSGATWSQEAYIKASNAGASDYFGNDVSLSSDGKRLAVGSSESSSATGIDGDQTDNSTLWSGAVYMFTHDGTSWSQEAYIKASNTDKSDHFGDAVSLSDNGNTLAVSATSEASIATGIDGDQDDNSAGGSGAVYVFTYDGTTWSQQAYIKSSNSEAGDYFGDALSLSDDGNTLAINSRYEASDANGVDGDQTNNNAESSGAVYVFTRSANVWSQQAYLKASNAETSDRFGYSLSLSGDGSTLAAAGYLEASSATGVDGDQTDNSEYQAGAVYVFTYDGTAWSQKTYLKSSNTESGDRLGYAVSLNSDGTTLAVSSTEESSAATGIDGDQTDNSATEAGAVYIY
jgi:hypothetical protein